MFSGGQKLCFFQFKVKPTERAKTEDGQPFVPARVEVMAVLDMWQLCCLIYNPQLATIPIQDLKTVKAEFGETETVNSSFHASVMTGMLRSGLQEVFPQAVVLQFVPRPKEPEIPESLVAKHIADDNNVERYEFVENVTLYTLKEYEDMMRPCRHLWTFCLLMRSNAISFVQKLFNRQIVSSGLIKDLDE